MSENRDSESYTREFLRLIEIMHRLRSENGCEWDRAQTHESLRQYLIEEAYRPQSKFPSSRTSHAPLTLALAV